MTSEIDENTAFADTGVRNIVPRFNKENRRANQQLVEPLGTISDEHGVNRAQIALAWVLAQKPWFAPIPGTTKLKHLRSNIGAAEITLTSDDLIQIENALSKIEVQGTRYPKELAERTGR